MSDLADTRGPSGPVWEAVLRAEAAAGITRDAEGNEVYSEADTPTATPELEGAVPVPASDQPLVPEPVVPAVEAPTDTLEQQQQEAPAVEPTAEELKAQLAAAEARIEEQKTMIGRQSTEVSETRTQIAELKAQIDVVQARQEVVPQAPVSTIQITQELIDTNPGAAVEAAFAQKDQRTLEIAFNAWKDPFTGDPFAAATWLNDKKLERQQEEFNAKLAETQRHIETATAPIAENVEQRAWADAFNEVKATRPDFMENAARLLEEVAPQYPSFLPALQSGDAKAKAEALSALYAMDKLGNPQLVQAQLEEAAQEASAEAAAARAAAGAVTGQSTAGQVTEQETEEEQEQQAYINRQRGKPSLSRGWTGRS